MLCYGYIIGSCAVDVEIVLSSNDLVWKFHKKVCQLLILLLLCQGGLPMYVAFRGLYNLKPPTVFVPPSIKEDIEKLLDIHRAMSQVELKVDLVALDVGMCA